MNNTPFRISISVLAIVVAGDLTMARAQDASAWDTDQHAGARLIGGAAMQSAGAKLLRAGVQIRLDSGWKTYWRYPGDSGVPPALDFAGSENVKSVTLLWPAPKQFDDGAGGQSIGYRGEVVLPLHIVPRDERKPSALRVKLDYAICGNLCVPAEAHLDLALSGTAGAEENVLLAAEARVPRRVSLATGGDLDIRAIHRATDGAHPRVYVDVAAPPGVDVALFAEGPTAEWALPLPRATSTDASGVRRFTFDLDGLPPGTKADGAVLTLTAVSPNDAIEVHAHLD